jgi:hypothetical protein
MFAKNPSEFDSSELLKWLLNLPNTQANQLSKNNRNMCAIITKCDIELYCKNDNYDSEIKTFFCKVDEKAAQQEDVVERSEVFSKTDYWSAAYGVAD